MKNTSNKNGRKLADIAKIACSTAVTFKAIYELCKFVMQ
jgi:hypothetical protein